jgi:hypothetical protein
VVDWRSFTPSNFEYDFECDKLSAHRVTFEEAVECSFPISRFGETRDFVTGTS